MKITNLFLIVSLLLSSQFLVQAQNRNVYKADLVLADGKNVKTQPVEIVLAKDVLEISGKKKSSEKTEELLRKFPEYNGKQFLDNEQVGVYLFRQGKPVEELKIREDGFEIATIDETVDRLNETSQNIYYELFD